MHIARKIQHFLRQGGASQIVFIHLNRRGTEIVHLWFLQKHILLWKGGLPPCGHQNSDISVILNDMVADLHFPRFFGTAIMWNSSAFSEKRSYETFNAKIAVFWVGLNIEPRRI